MLDNWQCCSVSLNTSYDFNRPASLSKVWLLCTLCKWIFLSSSKYCDLWTFLWQYLNRTSDLTLLSLLTSLLEEGKGGEMGKKMAQARSESSRSTQRENHHTFLLAILCTYFGHCYEKHFPWVAAAPSAWTPEWICTEQSQPRNLQTCSMN